LESTGKDSINRNKSKIKKTNENIKEKATTYVSLICFLVVRFVFYLCFFVDLFSWRLQPTENRWFNMTNAKKKEYPQCLESIIPDAEWFSELEMNMTEKMIEYNIETITILFISKAFNSCDNILGEISMISR
jgi:heme/copper-type cytochrome/quinol oxidase subunit 3